MIFQENVLLFPGYYEGIIMKIFIMKIFIKYYF